MSLQLAVFPFDRICQILGGVISSNLELFQTKHNKVPMKVLKYFPYIDFKDWLTQDNVFEWSDMSTHRLLF
jgi:hypothetical protein